MKRSRQLAAIMFTDIQGYTALMQQIEEKAIQSIITSQLKNFLLTITTSIIIALLIVVYLKFGTCSSPSSELQEKSIAVLAFENMRTIRSRNNQ